FASYPLKTKLLWTALLLLWWILWQLGVTIASLFWAAQSKTDRLAVAALILFIGVTTLAGPPMMSHNDSRYLHPLTIPTIVAGLASWAGRPHRRGVVTGWLAVCLIWPLANLPGKVAAWPRYVETVVTAQGEIAEWLNTHERPGVPVLVHDAGYLSETTDAALTDLVGLKTPSSIPIHQRWTAPS